MTGIGLSAEQSLADLIAWRLAGQPTTGIGYNVDSVGEVDGDGLYVGLTSQFPADGRPDLTVRVAFTIVDPT